MLHPGVAAGIVMLIVALLVRLALLSVADLSFILPLTAVGYVLAAVLGKFFLQEPVSLQRWLAVALIFAGAALVGSTPQATVARVQRTK
jgi:drug/metabolite transporter (DMT)-like permease